MPEGSEIPRNKFIYAIYDLKSGKIEFGYSPDQTDAKSTENIHQGIRNGGHVALTMKAFGFSSVKELELANPIGEGRFIGGGFLLGEDNYVYLHQLMSTKAAGSNGNTSFINPRLASNLSPIIPGDLTETFISALMDRLKKPMIVDNNMINSSRFRFNFDKHPEIVASNRPLSYGAPWLNRVVAEVNYAFLNIKIPNENIVHHAIRSGPLAIIYSSDLISEYFDTPEGEALIESIFKNDIESKKLIAEGIRPFEILVFMLIYNSRKSGLFDKFLQYIKSPEGSENFKNPDHKDTYPLFAQLVAEQSVDHVQWFLNNVLLKNELHHTNLSIFFTSLSGHSIHHQSLLFFLKKILKKNVRSFQGLLASKEIDLDSRKYSFVSDFLYENRLEILNEMKKKYDNTHPVFQEIYLNEIENNFPQKFLSFSGYQYFRENLSNSIENYKFLEEKKRTQTKVSPCENLLYKGK